MTYVELPLWIVICFVVVFTLTTIHLIFGDFIAKLIYKKFEKEDKE